MDLSSTINQGDHIHLNHLAMFRIVTISLLLTCSTLAWSQNKRSFTKQMEPAIATLDASETAGEYSEVVIAFQEICQKFPEEWLPDYYLAYALTIQSFKTEAGEAKDSLLDLAQEAVDRAMTLREEESELYVLQALIYQSRVQVDMMSRGPSMSMLQRSALYEAEQLNPDNPRIYLLRGQFTWFTPEFFGGGAEAARPSIFTAKEKYEAFEAPDQFWPAWGADRLQYYLDQYESAG